MPRLVGFGWFAALLEEQISEEIGRRIFSCDQRRPSGRALSPGRAPQSRKLADRLDAQRQDVPPRQQTAGLQPRRCGG